MTRNSCSFARNEAISRLQRAWVGVVRAARKRRHNARSADRRRRIEGALGAMIAGIAEQSMFVPV